MQIKKILTGAASGALLVGSLVTPVFAAGTNGSFESGTNPGVLITLTAVDTTNITDWTIATGTIDYNGTYWQASDGVRSLDMNGLSAGSVTQTLTTIPGATYKVSFAQSGNPDSAPVGDPNWSPSNKILRISATGAAFQDFNYDTSANGNSHADMKYENHAYTFVATGASTVLSFSSQIPGAYGPVLDNVVVKETLPGNKDECKNDGWKDFGVFKNQGDCVSFVATGGNNPPANP